MFQYLLSISSPWTPDVFHERMRDQFCMGASQDSTATREHFLN